MRVLKQSVEMTPRCLTLSQFLITICDPEVDLRKKLWQVPNDVLSIFVVVVLEHTHTPKDEVAKFHWKPEHHSPIDFHLKLVIWIYIDFVHKIYSLFFFWNRVV